MKHKQLKCQVNNIAFGRHYILLGQRATYLYQQGEYTQLTKIIIQITKSNKTLAYYTGFFVHILKLLQVLTILLFRNREIIKLSESTTVLKCVRKTLCNMLVHSFNHYNFNKHVVEFQATWQEFIFKSNFYIMISVLQIKPKL